MARILRILPPYSQHRSSVNITARSAALCASLHASCARFCGKASWAITILTSSYLPHMYRICRQNMCRFGRLSAMEVSLIPHGLFVMITAHSKKAWLFNFRGKVRAHMKYIRGFVACDSAHWVLDISNFLCILPSANSRHQATRHPLVKDSRSYAPLQQCRNAPSSFKHFHVECDSGQGLLLTHRNSFQNPISMTRSGKILKMCLTQGTTIGEKGRLKCFRSPFFYCNHQVMLLSCVRLSGSAGPHCLVFVIPST